MVLWLDVDAAAPLTARTADVDSPSAPRALAALSDPADMAATGALVVGTIAVA